MLSCVMHQKHLHMYGDVVLHVPFHVSFTVGNDCKKVLSMDGMLLFSDLLLPHQIWYDDDPAHDEMMGSYDLATQYCMYLHKLSKCHSLFSACRPLTDKEKQQFMSCVDDLSSYYATHFPTSSVTPKFHMLTYEMPLFLQKHGTIGMFSEQGLESLHPEYNRLDRTFSSIGHHNTVQKLECMHNQSMLEHDSRVLSFVSPTRVCPACKKPISKSDVNHCQCSKSKNLIT